MLINIMYNFINSNKTGEYKFWEEKEVIKNEGAYFETC
jgi:hypothetical protein